MTCVIWNNVSDLTNENLIKSIFPDENVKFEGESFFPFFSQMNQNDNFLICFQILNVYGQLRISTTRVT